MISNVIFGVIITLGLLMLLLGWIGVIWLWVGEFRDMYRHHSHKYRSKMGRRR